MFINSLRPEGIRSPCGGLYTAVERNKKLGTAEIFDGSDDVTVSLLIFAVVVVNVGVVKLNGSVVVTGGPIYQSILPLSRFCWSNLLHLYQCAYTEEAVLVLSPSAVSVLATE